MKRRSIIINENQDNWIESNSVNLSKYVRNKINEDMDKEVKNEKKG